MFVEILGSAKDFVSTESKDNVRGIDTDFFVGNRSNYTYGTFFFFFLFPSIEDSAMPYPVETRVR